MIKLIKRKLTQKINSLFENESITENIGDYEFYMEETYGDSWCYSVKYKDETLFFKRRTSKDLAEKAINYYKELLTGVEPVEIFLVGNRYILDYPDFEKVAQDWRDPSKENLDFFDYVKAGEVSINKSQIKEFPLYKLK